MIDDCGCMGGVLNALGGVPGITSGDFSAMK